MKRIEDVDKNFNFETNIEKKDIVFYNALDKPFKIYGIFYEDGKFRRMPECVAESVSEGVFALHTNTTGGRVCFKTSSSYVAINVGIEPIGQLRNMTLAGSTGFDLYVRENENDTYYGTYIPPCDVGDSFESIVEFKSSKMREITINFPVYSNVTHLYIGLSKDAEMDESFPYKNEKPVVFYGSSITQGGCASRPGNIYPAIVSRKLELDFINLGFSGNAKGEKEISEYIKKLDMFAFIYDYDYNAPDVEHLRNTHERMFLDIRNQNMDLPIILMTRPKLYKLLDESERERFEIIKTTYENAKRRGDRNVYFISGDRLMSLAQSEGLVDNCHPNDFGFYSMADAVIEVLENIFRQNER